MSRFQLFRLVVCAALITATFPTLSQATEIDVNVTIDLNNSILGAGANGFLMGWGTSYISFPEVYPVAGDKLIIKVNFVNSITNQPQRLQVSDLGSGIGQGIFATAQGPGLSLTADTNNYFTFNRVMGNLINNPVSGMEHSSGAGVGATIITNLTNMPLTNSSFSFSGITWEIDFSQLTYYSGNGFNVAAINLGADQISIVPPVSQQLAALLTEVTGVGPGTSLADKVTAVQAYYAASDTQATCATLTAFVNEVQAQDGKKIGQTLDAKLIADADAIKAAIGCN
jgi:hypothetical protein